MEHFFEKRRNFIGPVLASLLVIAAVFTGIYLVSNNLISVCNPDGGFFAMSKIISASDQGNIFANLVYTLCDISNGPFFTDFFVAVMMFLTALLARFLEIIKAPIAGTGTEGSGYRFKWLVAVQLTAMFCANIFWRHIIGLTGSIETFTCAFSVTPISVLYYGKPDLKKAVTGVILGMFLPVFVVRFLTAQLVAPYGLPGFLSVGTGMALSTVIATEIFNFLPWMHVNPNPGRDDSIVIVDNKRKSEAWLTFIRVFGGDISELYFWGASVSGIGVIIGCLITWFVNPYANANGLSLMKILCCFMITSCISIFIWGPKLKRDGFAFTFEPLLVVGSLLGFCQNIFVIPLLIVSAVLIAPAVVHKALSTKFFQRYHACVSVQFCGAMMVTVFYLLFHLFGLM